jgi:hypothetical protein
LGNEVAQNHSSSVLLVGDRPALLIQSSDEAPAQGAIHLDLRPDNAAAAVAQALSLGPATSTSDRTAPRVGPCWQTLPVITSASSNAADHARRLEADPGTRTPID